MFGQSLVAGKVAKTVAEGVAWVGGLDEKERKEFGKAVGSLTAITIGVVTLDVAGSSVSVGEIIAENILDDYI